MEHYKKLYLVSFLGYLTLTILMLAWESPTGSIYDLIFPTGLLPFTVISVIAAWEYRKLPLGKKVKPRWFAHSIFRSHPYFITGAFVLINMLFFVLGIWRFINL